MIDWNTIGDDQGRFTLHEDGQITWQPNKTNPLPGEVVAHIEKGEAILSPTVKIVNADDMDEAQEKEISAKIVSWIETHIKEILAPLFRLKDETENKLEGAAKEIGDKVFDNLGVVHRSDIEKHIPDLTPELRATIRQKKVKMGPILVFMYELVKPAAINLRALLWGLWNGKTLPVERPADGRVSIAVDAQAIDRNYMRSICYPVFGNLAIRIDMLDRVVTDIYDSSKDFKFKAQHKYMEWLGCGEEDLYAVLQSMGFRKLKEEAQVTDGVKASEEETPVSKTEEKTVESSEEAPKPQEKPELATFLLKKGKVSDRPAPKNNRKPQKSNKKPHKGQKKDRNMAKTYNSAPKKVEVADEDNPFAILKQLQK